MKALTVIVTMKNEKTFKLKSSYKNVGAFFVKFQKMKFKIKLIYMFTFMMLFKNMMTDAEENAYLEMCNSRSMLTDDFIEKHKNHTLEDIIIDFIIMIYM